MDFKWNAKKFFFNVTGLSLSNRKQQNVFSYRRPHPSTLIFISFTPVFLFQVLMELRRHQSELRTIMQKNKRAAETLLEKAQKEMKRQELKQRAKVVDAEVMDSFRKVTAAKQKKRNLTKKEKDTAWKALRDRESILKLLDSQK